MSHKMLRQFIIEVSVGLLSPKYDNIYLIRCYKPTYITLRTLITNIYV